ncbi:MAG: alkyl hydroperoxide reductase [Ignavibacteria bacterium GWF2_33_9]|nr:MAG: alkyl hydroperoxide reductase [Ignavibacteria bacterium GWF2_33_9]
MKKFLNISISVIILLLVINIQNTYTINAKELPKVTVTDLLGKKINANEFNNDGKPILIDFWATWCVPCVRELTNLDKVYPKWQEETGVKLIAISIDDTRTSKKVAPFVKGRKWTFEFYLDENSELKRAMNVTNPPHTFLVNSKGEIVWEHSGYAEGGEVEIYKQIKDLLEKEKESK